MIVTLAGVASAWPSRALALEKAAPSDKQQCIDAHASAQELRLDKKLRAAKELLLVCSLQACPPLVVRECSELLTTVTGELPTLAVSIVLANGDAVTEAEVEIDGAPWRGLGAAFEIDPGVHTIRVEHPTHGEVSKTVTVVEGRKAQAVQLEFPAPRVAEPLRPTLESERSYVPPAGAFVFFGLTVGAAATGIALGVTSIEAESDVKTQADLDALEDLRLAADIAFIATGAFAATGLVWWIVDAASGGSSQTTSAAISPRVTGGLSPLAGWLRLEVNAL